MKTTILEMPSTRSSKLKTQSGHPRHPSPPASTASTACKCATSSVAKNTLAKKTKVDNEMTGKGKREKGKGKREKGKGKREKGKGKREKGKGKREKGKGKKMGKRQVRKYFILLRTKFLAGKLLPSSPPRMQKQRLAYPLTSKGKDLLY